MSDNFANYSETTIKGLAKVYKNKSGDEYKMKGDITKHPHYEQLSKDINSLGDGVKNAPTKVITGVKDMFASLHKPIWKKMIPEYMAKPNDKNTAYALGFATSIRIMISVIMTIYTFTEAKEEGLVYNEPNKLSDDDKVRYEFISKFGKDFDKNVEKWYEQASVKAKKNAPKTATKEEVTQEAASLGVVSTAANTVVGVVEGVFGILNGLFRTAASLNPISLISACLSRSYDKKVEQYEKISKEYEAAKKAYDEYKKIPAAQRKKRIESNYVKMIEKYNIKMKNLKAKIDHYDTRANKGSEDDDDDDKTTASSSTKSGGNKNNTSDKGDKDLPDSSSTVDTSDNKRDDLDF